MSGSRKIPKTKIITLIEKGIVDISAENTDNGIAMSWFICDQEPEELTDSDVDLLAEAALEILCYDDKRQLITRALYTDAKKFEGKAIDLGRAKNYYITHGKLSKDLITTFIGEENLSIDY